ncbi:MAG TPA: hypothetical protein ENN51_05710, partial [candidate division WOR-3 bacterium]|nr:hypothetical protein [candidate division WOR-3 bacterium]
LHEDHDLVERLLQKAGLGYGAPLNEALEAMDGYVKLLPGTIVLDPELGPARLRRLDLLLSRATVESRAGESLKLDLTAALSRLRPVQPDGFFELLLEDPDRLRAETAENPGQAIRGLLRDLRRPLTAGEIRDHFAEVVAAADWSATWNRARRDLDQHPHVRTVSRPSRGYEWSDRPIEHRSAKRTGGPDRASQTGAGDIGGLNVTALRDRYAALKTLTDRRRLIRQVCAERPDDTAEILAAFFPVGRDARARTQVAELLAEAGPDRLGECVRQVVTSYRQVPDAFAWVARNCVSRFEVRPSALLSRLLDLLESPDFRAQAPALRDALVGDDYRLISEGLEAFDADGARRLLDRLHRLPGIEDYRHDELTALVHERFAELRKTVADNAILTTAEGYARARNELDRLTREELPKNIEELAAARAQGDLSENYEYKAAKEKQARLMGQVERLRGELARASVIEPGNVDTSAVSVGCRVKLAGDDGTETEYRLLGPWDSDPDRRIISYLAPLGNAMLGHKPGETFEFDGRFYTVRVVAGP